MDSEIKKMNCITVLNSGMPGSSAHNPGSLHSMA
jgi:hypothetical protein